MSKLYVIDGPDRGKYFNLNEGITTVGRSSDNDICLSEIGVSQHHAKIIMEDSRIFIVDVSNSPGVLIDGAKIEPGQEVEIKKESNFIIGNTLLSLQKDSSEKSLPPTSSIDIERRPFDKSESSFPGGGSRNYVRSLELLFKVSNILAQSLNIDHLLGEVIDQIFNLLKRIDRCAILLLNNETGQLEEVVSKTRLDAKGGLSSKINYSKTLLDMVIEEAEPIMMPDTSREKRADLLDSSELKNVMSVMCVPLIYKGEVQGIIYVDSIESPNGFRKDDIQLLTALSDTAAIAIENARLYKALKQELAERKRAEEELGRTCRELQETRDMLVQSEKLAAIGRLAAAVAHEILNPVNIMSMRLQFLDQIEDLPNPTRNALNICKDQLNRITEITRDLRQVSGSSKKHIAMSDVNKMIEHVLTLGAPQFKQKHIQTDIRYHAELPLIPLDKDRIEQVIFNLISNATEAMAGKETKLLGIITKPSTSKDFVQVIVSDTGTGIDLNHMNKIFDPFFTTKDSGMGTGLGLFISYGIIHDHGGRIWAENNESGGASFFVELPVGRDFNG